MLAPGLSVRMNELGLHRFPTSTRSKVCIGSPPMGGVFSTRSHRSRPRISFIGSHRFSTNSCGLQEGCIGSQPAPLTELHLGSEPIKGLMKRVHRFSTNSRRQRRIGSRPNQRRAPRFCGVWAGRAEDQGSFTGLAIGWETMKHRFPTMVSWLSGDPVIVSEPMLGCRSIVEKRWLTRLRAERSLGGEPMRSARTPCGTRRHKQSSLGNLLKSAHALFAKLQFWFGTDEKQKRSARKPAGQIRMWQWTRWIIE